MADKPKETEDARMAKERNVSVDVYRKDQALEASVEKKKKSKLYAHPRGGR